MIVGQIVERIRDQVPTLRRSVEPSLDIAGMVGDVVRAPVAYVAPTGDRGAPDLLVGDRMQQVTRTIVVLLGLPSRNDKTGGNAVDDLEVLRTAVRSALHGWQPAGADSPCVYTGGRLAGLPAGAVWWAITISIDTYEDTEEP